MNRSIEQYINEHMEYVIGLAKEISRIPSPSGQEEKKAEFIINRLEEITGKTLRTDAAGNVIYIHNPEINKKMSVYVAHIDTVFDAAIIPELYQSGSRIYAPSICDNSINIAALIFLIKAFRESVLRTDKKLCFAFDVGEEGQGNLKGIRHIMDEMHDSIDEVIALDLGYDSVINKAAGSKRYEVSISTPGGHSWKDFGSPSAIAAAVSIICEIYGIIPPGPGKSTYNVGEIRGGTSVNTIAASCVFNVDLRSEDGEILALLDEKFCDIIKKNNTDKVDIKCSVIGERPCGRPVPGSSLEKRLIETRKSLGLEMKYISGSTDANIPLSMGIPAVAFGVCNGGGVHTLNEYIDTDTLETGLKHLVCFMLM